MGATFSDMPERSWIDRFAPGAVRPYLRLMRLDRPVGTWLLLLPCWWGLALAPRPDGFGWPDARLAALFAIGALVMRGAGCVVNDVIDRDIDAKVERTRARPIPSGQVGVGGALLLLALLLLLGLMVLLQFNRATLWIGAASLALVFPYPLMKRLTWWPQLVLGLAFNWGALLGWTAVTGRLDAPPLLLYAGGVFWTLAYDTIYAHQDKADDARIGIRSSALRLGAASRRAVGTFYMLAAGLICAAAALADLHRIFLLPCGGALAWALLDVARWRPDSPADCLARFRNATRFGWLVLLGLILGRWAVRLGAA